MNLEKYLVDVLGIKKLYLDPDFIRTQQQASEQPEEILLKQLDQLKNSTAKTLFIVLQNDLSATESTMLGKMAEALNWKDQHDCLTFPEHLEEDTQSLLIEMITERLKKNSQHKMILFTEDPALKKTSELDSFINIHHARICDLPRSISVSQELKKITWDKIKMMKV